MRAPGDAARAFAVRVDRERESLSSRSWASRVGDADARLTGFAAGDTLRLVREVLNQGETGRQAARYYYAGPRLRYYEAEASRRPPSGSTMERVRLVLAFDESGRLVEGTHQVDGAVVALDSVMIRGVVARASDVARQWATVPASTPAAPAGAGDAVKR